MSFSSAEACCFRFVFLYFDVKKYSTVLLDQHSHIFFPFTSMLLSCFAEEEVNKKRCLSFSFCGNQITLKYSFYRNFVWFRFLIGLKSSSMMDKFGWFFFSNFNKVENGVLEWGKVSNISTCSYLIINDKTHHFRNIFWCWSFFYLYRRCKYHENKHLFYNTTPKL